MSSKPLNMSTGKVGGIFAIFDEESHFCVMKRLRNRPSGHSRTMCGMEQNVFSIMRAEIWNKKVRAVSMGSAMKY